MLFHTFTFFLSYHLISFSHSEQTMFQNDECDATVGDVASSFSGRGILNSNVADVFLLALRMKYRGTETLIVPRWLTVSVTCYSQSILVLPYSWSLHVFLTVY